MPHLTYEYSQNLKHKDLQTLVDKSAQVLIEQKKQVDGKQANLYPTGGIRVRAICLDTYAIADGTGADDAFVHAHLKIGKGRTPEQLKKTCDELFALMREHFADEFETRGIALSLEYSEFANGTWKKNNIHERYR